VGYCRDEEGEVIVDPDEEVCGAVGEVFAMFTEVGSAYAVVARCPGGVSRAAPTGAPGPGSCGSVADPFAGLLHLVQPGLRRRRTSTAGSVPNAPSPRRGVHTSTVELPRAQWAVCIQDHHAAYISWATF